ACAAVFAFGQASSSRAVTSAAVPVSFGPAQLARFYDTGPVGNPDSYEVVRTETLTVSAPGLPANDDPGTSVVAEDTTAPKDGSLQQIGPDGSFTYTPDDDFVGVDSFTYVIADQAGAQSSPIEVSITVLPAVLYVNAQWAGTQPGTDPDGDGPATAFGVDSFATIGDAVSAAEAGTTILVYPGSYTEANGLTVEPDEVALIPATDDRPSLTLPTRGITLNGASDAIIGIDLIAGRPLGDGGKVVDAEGAEDAVEDLSITGGGGGTGVYATVDAAPGSDPTVAVADLDISNTSIAVELDGIADGIVVDNTLHDLVGSGSIGVLVDDAVDNQPSEGSRVAGNTIAGANHGMDVETSNDEIDANTISGGTTGIYVSRDSFDDVEDTVISTNTIESAGYSGI